MKKSTILSAICIQLLVFTSNCNTTKKSKDKAILFTDLHKLEKIISLPAKPISCEWQTGAYGSGQDWWIAAILQFRQEDRPRFLTQPSKREWIDVPNGLKFDNSFSFLKQFSNAPQESVGVRFESETFSISPYVSSPLLNGKATELPNSKVFIVLWTQ